MRRLSFAVATLTAAALALLPAGIAAGHGDKLTARSADERTAAAAPLPFLTSDNVNFLANFPDTQMISGVHARTGNFFYASSLDSITVFDTSNPALPVPRGTIANLTFENEAITYGERREANGKLVRFVLIGFDLYNVSPDPDHLNVLGRELAIVDVTDPDNPFIRSSTPARGQPGAVTTSTHTVTCSNVIRCEWGYSAGSRGVASIIDLRDLDNPREVTTIKSPANGPNPVFRSGAGHRWDIDDAGYAFHTGSGGGALFKTLHRQGLPDLPKLVNATNARGIESPFNDFILHNSQRPNAKLFQPRTAPSVFKGNVLLITEEDYFNDGEEAICNQAGSIQTWYVPTLNDPTGVDDTKPSTGNIRPLDIANIPAEGKAPLNEAGAFCSAHWFDFHQSGILAQGFYQQGLRLVDVRDPYNIKEYGFFTGGASEVWDAYWVPKRDANGVATGKRTNIVYTADLVRGIDVFCVEMPVSGAQKDCPTLPLGADGGKATATASTGPVSGNFAAALPVLGLALVIGAARRVRRRPDVTVG